MKSTSLESDMQMHHAARLRRPLNGVVILDKPVGLSSRQALDKVKRIFSAQKAGHTGSLDPLASGMLPICLGEATKFAQYVLHSDKTYYVLAQLGIRTNTADCTGEILRKRTVPKLTVNILDRAFDAFRGNTQQIPPMYSALKHQGQPLYRLARQGISLTRPARPIRIDWLTLLSFSNNLLAFQMKCSKGTYVRSLVDDYGEALGCGACVVALRRLSVEPYSSQSMVTIEQLEQLRTVTHDNNHDDRIDQHILPVSTTVSQLPKVQLSVEESTRLYHGQPIKMSHTTLPPPNTHLRLTTNTGAFLGIGVVSETGQCLKPKRLMQAQPFSKHSHSAMCIVKCKGAETSPRRFGPND